MKKFVTAALLFALATVSIGCGSATTTKPAMTTTPTTTAVATTPASTPATLSTPASK